MRLGSDTVENKKCALDLYNGVTKYFIELANSLYVNKIENDFSVKDIPYALLSVLSFDLAFNKEKMVEKGGKKAYSSKMSDDALDYMLDLLFL